MACDSSDSDEQINSARAVKLALELHALGLGGINGGGVECESDSGKNQISKEQIKNFNKDFTVCLLI